MPPHAESTLLLYMMPALGKTEKNPRGRFGGIEFCGIRNILFVGKTLCNTQKFAWKFNYIRMYGARSFFSYFLFDSLVFPIFYSLAFSILYICLFQYCTLVFSIFYISLFNILHLPFQYSTSTFSIFYTYLFNILRLPFLHSLSNIFILFFSSR